MRRIELQVGDERFVALAWGPAQGAPILLLHGFPDIPASWRAVGTRLAADGRRWVAPYLRGYGASTARVPFHVDRLAADVLAWAEALGGGEPVHLVGHDWGAAAAYVAAMRAPERFASLAALSLPHPLTFFRGFARHPGQLVRSWYMGFFQLPRLPEAALRAGLVERLWRAWSPGFEPPRAHLEEVHATLVRSLPAPLEYYRSIARPPGEAWRRIRDARGQRIAVPTLYLHGRRDGCVAPGLARGQARRFAAPLQAAEIEDAGHFLPVERPEAVATALRRHLHRHAGR